MKHPGNHRRAAQSNPDNSIIASLCAKPAAPSALTPPTYYYHPPTGAMWSGAYAEDLMAWSHGVDSHYGISSYQQASTRDASGVPLQANETSEMMRNTETTVETEDPECMLHDLGQFCAQCSEDPESAKAVKFGGKARTTIFDLKKIREIVDFSAEANVLDKWIPGLGMPLEEVLAGAKSPSEPVDSDLDVDSGFGVLESCGQCGRDFSTLKTTEGPGQCLDCRTRWLHMYWEEQAAATVAATKTVKAVKAPVATKKTTMKRVPGKSQYDWALFEKTGCFDVL